MKKSLAVLLALVMVLGTLAGCSGDNNSSTADQSSAAQESSTASEDSTAEESAAEESGSTEGLLDPIENTDGTLQVPRSSYVTYPVEGGGALEYWMCAAGNIVSGIGSVEETAWAKALQKRNSREMLQQSGCWSRSRAKTVMLHRRNSRFYPSMSAGVVLPMRLTRANQTGQQNITS